MALGRAGAGKGKRRSFVVRNCFSLASLNSSGLVTQMRPTSLTLDAPTWLSPASFREPVTKKARIVTCYSERMGGAAVTRSYYLRALCGV